MCTNAEKKVAALFVPVKSSILLVLTDLKLTDTTTGQAIIAELNNISTDLANWVPGTAAQETIQVLGDVAVAIQSIPGVPPNVYLLIGVPLAGIQGIIGVLSGNGPTPAGANEVAFRSHVMARTFQAVKTTAKTFRYHKGVFSFLEDDDAAKQYSRFWNEQCDANDAPQLKLT